ncbi:MAG: glycoside hydrolase family 1 protein [Nitrospiraceae bacterium]|nr:glycoside hydrolase family 1 protein [Nitrospiraceae bacterium]MDA8091055.1 glycoside hydrolase family 1 protein [Nitrospiraceae bacterium]
MGNKKFLWGVATSAFQLEGSVHADWASWDPALKRRPEASNHYELYREDLRLLKELGVNAYRFSMEWSRIEPEEGRWDEKALDHYRHLVDLLCESGIEPMITLHHFTHPVWFLKKYPWHTGNSADRFLGFAEKIVSRFNDVRYWITFNEPYVFLLGGYLEGCMPPGIRDAALALKAIEHMLHCHARAYDMIHEKRADAMVSVAHNMAAFSPWRRWNPADRLLSGIAARFYNQSLIDAFMRGVLEVRFPFQKPLEIKAPVQGKLDFFGVNYYTRIHMRFNPFRKMGVELRHRDLDGRGLTDLGWEIHPEGLRKMVEYAGRLKVPVIITENGIATNDDDRKIDFLRRHVAVVQRCIRDGLDIRGYFYWSLVDNYEWIQGFDSRFGLYTVDFDSFQRKPTRAAAYYSHFIRSTRTGSSY